MIADQAAQHTQTPDQRDKAIADQATPHPLYTSTPDWDVSLVYRFPPRDKSWSRSGLRAKRNRYSHGWMEQIWVDHRSSTKSQKKLTFLSGLGADLI